MTDPINYTKQPVVTGAIPQYIDAELRKVEKSIESLVAFALEELEMSIIESGMFLPILAGNTVAGVGTYTAQVGQYFKFNRFVIVQYRVTTSAHTGTGSARINNLPFKTKNSPNGFFSGSVYSGVNAVTLALANPNSTNLDFYNGATGLAMVAAMDLLGSICYFID